MDAPYFEDAEIPVRDTILMPSGAVFDRIVGERILQAQYDALQEELTQAEKEMSDAATPVE